MQEFHGADNSKEQTIQKPFPLGLRRHYANFWQQIYLLYYILLRFTVKKVVSILPEYMCGCVVGRGGGKGVGMASLVFKRIIKP